MQQRQRNTQRPLIAAAAVLAVAAVAGCGQRDAGNTPDGVKAPPPATTTSTAPAPAPATTVPPAADVKPSTDPASVPGKATEVTQDKGTQTGMPGGEAGTVASSGKPGSGTSSGAGTGPAVSSGEKTENKK